MKPIDAASIAIVIETLPLERATLLDLLRDLDDTSWDHATECPAYSVKGIATHLLGDDLSLLSRQRDGAPPGLFLVAERQPGADFRTLLDTFNDDWVEAARFLSPPLLIELLRLCGEWSVAYYRQVNPSNDGEPVPLFDPPPGEGSPVWQAIAREYLERWAHQSQIRRAIGLPSLETAPFLEVGAQIVATAAETPLTSPAGADDEWRIGPLVLGSTTQTADILTLAHTASEIRSLVRGPDELVDQFAARVGRRNDG